MFEVYKDKSGRWRWRFVARNGKIIADGGQGYASKAAVLKAVATVKIAVKAARAKKVKEL